LDHQVHATAELPPNGVNKWEALRELAAARAVFGLSDRDMTVLQALVSFHKATILGGNDNDLLIYPSNKAICERLNGMPCSTMRRHLAHLVASGMIIRRDSPNGKRYARQYGGEKIAFGFDLTPLATRFHDICAAAEEIRAGQLQYKRLREAVSLMRRDLAGLVAYGEALQPGAKLWENLKDMAILVAKHLRRKLTLAELEDLRDNLLEALSCSRRIIDGNTEEMITNESHNEQHYQNSNKDSYDSELYLEKVKGEVSGEQEPQSPISAEKDDIEAMLSSSQKLPNIPLRLVLDTCAEIQTYSSDPIRHWHELVRAADIVCPMMGISPSAWDDARLAMGPEEAAVVVAAMLERFAEIKSHGGYLRHLTLKAADGAFSCGPMIMALMRKVAA
jgi:replication initiation protein RepC